MKPQFHTPPSIEPMRATQSRDPVALLAWALTGVAVVVMAIAFAFASSFAEAIDLIKAIATFLAFLLAVTAIAVAFNPSRNPVE
jgi:hypothetical protein